MVLIRLSHSVFKGPLLQGVQEIGKSPKAGGRTRQSLESKSLMVNLNGEKGQQAFLGAHGGQMRRSG